MSTPGRIAWWLCQPSLGRALLCGVSAAYLGTFIGADAVTMFAAVQAVRLGIRAVGPKRLVQIVRRFPTLRSGKSAASTRTERRPVIDLRPPLIEPHGPDGGQSMTLDELIAGDPGPEPGDPGPGLPGSDSYPSRADVDDRAPMATGVDGGVTLSTNGAGTAVGSDVAQALRMAVAETG
jgi:hypothetical protein